ncbi:MAG: alcohol dehydrogenase catalytic domain-containing protein [Blautia marasmi]
MLIRMLVCGTCLSEYPDWKEGLSIGKVMGHEPVGIVEKVGSRITKFKEGDRVTGLLRGICGIYCIQGRIGNTSAGSAYR